MDYKAIFKKIAIKIFILIVIMLILYFAIKILYSQDALYKTSYEQALRIIDGDTFATSNEETIRLLCVDTPEINQKGYLDSKNFLSNSILGKEVIIERQGIDMYNRTLAWVSVNNTNEIILVNKDIIKKGFGTLFEYNGTNCERTN